MYVKFHKETLEIKSITKDKPSSERNYIILYAPNVRTTNIENVIVEKHGNSYYIREYTQNEKNQLEYQKLVFKKEKLLSDLQKYVENYIIFFYPRTKQLSDVIDATYYRLAIVQTNQTLITELEIQNEATFVSYDILQFKYTLKDYLQNKPEYQRKYWEQLLKAFIRAIWLQQVKDIYRDYCRAIKNATKLEELPHIPFDELKYPELNKPNKIFPRFVDLNVD